MSTKTLFIGGLIFSLSAFACSAADDQSTGTTGAEEDLTARSEVKGAWHVGEKAFDPNEAIVLHTDGTFIHDQTRILNGVLIAGGPPPGRDIGTFTVSRAKGTITLHVKSGWHAGEVEVYEYEYTPAKIMNGVYLPGAEPTASLDLTKAPPTNGSKIAYPTVHFSLQDSYCNGLPNVADADCEIERTEKLWVPDSSGVSTCNVSTNKCETKFVAE